jgi:hypothetical protein
MKQLKLKLQRPVPTVHQGIPLLRKPGDAVIVERGRPRHLLIACPCGCGEAYPVNLDPRTGPAWRLRTNRGSSSVTLFPSVWRESGCRSHFIIWRDHILLFDEADHGGLSLTSQEYDSLTGEILGRVEGVGFFEPAAMAEAIDADPWDVMTACRMLAKGGHLLPGTGRYKGYFRRR